MPDPGAPLVLVSNRGPVTYQEDGSVKRGTGGLATALIGMGISSLSMAARAVRPVGAQLGKVSFETCEAAADAALGAPDPMAARAAVRELLGH